MRIAVYTDGPSPHLFPLLEAWSDSGESVKVLMDRRQGRFGGPEVTRLALSSLDWLSVAYRGTWRFLVPLARYRRLQRHLEAADVLVLGTYASMTALLLLTLARRRHIPVVLHLERPSPRPPSLGRWLRDAVLRNTCRRADLVWPMSAAGRAEYAAVGARIGATVPYPLDPTVWPAPDAHELQRPLGPRRIVVVGSLIAGKQPLLAVDAARRLLAKGDAVELRLVGTGPLADAVREAAAGLPVVLLGHLDPEGVRRELLAADVLLHPSAYDGWGMAVAEAAACGCAIVATGGTDAATELATVSGSMIRLAEPDALADAVAEVLRALEARPSAERALAARTVTGLLSPPTLAARARQDLLRLVSVGRAAR